MNFTTDIVIGLEIHIELDTKSKLFCGCSTQSEEPNTATCEVCLGMPGSKPVLNKKAVDYALKLCLALGCRVAPELVFSRKSYFYPDLSKNYQITQYEMPLGLGGKLDNVGITRVHIEEDPASLVHPASITTSKFVLIDYNRSGHPLCEIVTEPEINSPEDAREFMKKLITLLKYLGIFHPNGIIKADANVSVKESGYTRVEIKNISGFKEIERALKYEVDRQKSEVKDGKKIRQETRGWDAETGITYLLRVKETEDDYGYIIDPDLVVTDINEEWVKQTQKSLPELPAGRIKRYTSLGLAAEDAEVITADYSLAMMFDKVAKNSDPVLASKWMRKELVKVANQNNKEIDELPITETHLIELFQMLKNNEITDKVGQQILKKLAKEPFSPREYATKEGLIGVAESSDVSKYVDEAIKENPKVVDDYKKGNEKAINFLVGAVMKKTKGKAKPDELLEMIKNKI